MVRKLSIYILLIIGVHPISALCNSNNFWDESIWKVAGNYAGVTPEVLYSIALRESGIKWVDGKSRPWPWTVNSPKGSLRLSNKDEAYAAIGKLKREGVKNIDVGWMQVNLGHHGGWIEKYDYMDPVVNVLLASVILKDAMLKSNGDVMLAAGRYHSWDLVKGHDYASKVKEVRRLLDLNLK